MLLIIKIGPVLFDVLAHRFEWLLRGALGLGPHCIKALCVIFN